MQSFGPQKKPATVADVYQKKDAEAKSFYYADNRNTIAQSKGLYLEDNRPQTIQRKPNNTGLPDQLKAGVESLSGISMDDVKVHYNSAKPAQLRALAYAQGTNIHVAPGQEKHLPHEAWHVVQQKQGRVQPTMQLKTGVDVNDDNGLESEASVMGDAAIKSGLNDDSWDEDVKDVDISDKNLMQGKFYFDTKILQKKDHETVINYLKQTRPKSELIAFEQLSADDLDYQLVDWLEYNLGVNLATIKQEVEANKASDDNYEEDDQEKEESKYYESLKSIKISLPKKVPHLRSNEGKPVEKENIPLLALMTIGAGEQTIFNIRHQQVDKTFTVLNEVDDLIIKAADPEKLDALVWAKNILRGMLYSKAKTKRSSTGNLSVDLKDDNIDIDGRPAFLDDATNLKINKGEHRRHVIAWHTIRKATKNIINYATGRSDNKQENKTLINRRFGLNKFEKSLINDQINTLRDSAAASTSTKVKKAKEEKIKELQLLLGDKNGYENINARIKFQLTKWNSNVKNLWPGSGYENSLINIYQTLLRSWGRTFTEKLKDPGSAIEFIKEVQDILEQKLASSKDAASPEIYKNIVGTILEIVKDWNSMVATNPQLHISQVKSKEKDQKSEMMKMALLLTEMADSYDTDYPYMSTDGPPDKQQQAKNPFDQSRNEQIKNMLDNQKSGGVTHGGDQKRLYDKGIVIEPELLKIGGRLLAIADKSDPIFEQTDPKKIMDEYMELMRSFMNIKSADDVEIENNLF